MNYTAPHPLDYLILHAYGDGIFPINSLILAKVQSNCRDHEALIKSRFDEYYSSLSPETEAIKLLESIEAEGEVVFPLLYEKAFGIAAPVFGRDPTENATLSRAAQCLALFGELRQAVVAQCRVLGEDISELPQEVKRLETRYLQFRKSVDLPGWRHCSDAFKKTFYVLEAIQRIEFLREANPFAKRAAAALTPLYRIRQSPLVFWEELSRRIGQLSAELGRERESGDRVYSRSVSKVLGGQILAGHGYQPREKLFTDKPYQSRFDKAIASAPGIAEPDSDPRAGAGTRTLWRFHRGRLKAYADEHRIAEESVPWEWLFPKRKSVLPITP